LILEQNGMIDNLRTLILDDDPVYLRLAAKMLKEDFTVYTALCPSVAFDLLSKERIDVLICDFYLPEMNGVEVVKKVKELHPETDVIMISGSPENEHIVEAFSLGVIDFFQKPFEYKPLKISIERTKKFVALKKKSKQIEQYNSFLSQKLNKDNSVEIIACSKVMQQVRKTMSELAKSDDVSVLISGEVGLCKESVACAIHIMSCRSNYHFAALNTSSVSDALFERRFFGYDKSVSHNEFEEELGWLQVAHGGTLFFDEIADMTIYQQTKLFGVLENRKYATVGSRKIKDFNVRIISASCMDLNDLKTGKDFRLDLLGKLDGYELNIPPLRDRQEDIPLLMNHFIRKHSEKLRKEIKGFDRFAENKLVEYSFPGNIRELSNLIERAVILCDGDSLNLDHFPSFVSESAQEGNIVHSFDLGLIEREVIIKALKECDYNKSKAAKLLNINWNALHRRLQKFGIELPEHCL